MKYLYLFHPFTPSYTIFCYVYYGNSFDEIYTQTAKIAEYIYNLHVHMH